MNRIRDLIEKIRLLRKRQPPPIGGYDFIRLNHYSFYCEPETTERILKELYETLENGEGAFPEDAPRFLLAGRVVGVGDYIVPKLIETSGGVLAAEFLDEGLRHSSWKVPVEGDLMKNLGRTYYLERTPPSIFQPAWERRVRSLRRIISDFNIDGVIWYQLSFDEIYDMECPIVTRALEETKIPLLKLDTSYGYSREATGPLVTRIESFVESIKQRRR